MNSKAINFPPEISEETRLQVCKLLFEKDQQIQKLEDKIFDLDEHLSKFNGGLKWNEAENLRQEMNNIKYENEATTRELKNFNLRAIRYVVDDFHPSRDGAIRPFDIKIEKIPLRERLITWLKSFIKFSIVKNS